MAEQQEARLLVLSYAPVHSHVGSGQHNKITIEA